MLLVPSQQTSKALYAGNSLFVDNVTGSDDTGQRGRADYPFYSLYALSAMMNAFLNDLGLY